MNKVLNELILKESSALNDLLELLEEQHQLYLDKDVFGLEGIVKKIEAANIAVAKLEVERRKLLGNKAMKDIAEEYNDEELEKNIVFVKQVAEKAKFQNTTNQVLFKQGLMFTNKMLNIFSPGKNNAKTYNGYGKIRR